MRESSTVRVCVGTPCARGQDTHLHQPRWLMYSHTGSLLLSEDVAVGASPVTAAAAADTAADAAAAAAASIWASCPAPAAAASAVSAVLGGREPAASDGGGVLAAAAAAAAVAAAKAAAVPPAVMGSFNIASVTLHPHSFSSASRSCAAAAAPLPPPSDDPAPPPPCCCCCSPPGLVGVSRGTSGCQSAPVRPWLLSVAVVRSVRGVYRNPACTCLIKSSSLL